VVLLTDSADDQNAPEIVNGPLQFADADQAALVRQFCSTNSSQNSYTQQLYLFDRGSWIRRKLPAEIGSSAGSIGYPFDGGRLVLASGANSPAMYSKDDGNSWMVVPSTPDATTTEIVDSDVGVFRCAAGGETGGCRDPAIVVYDGDTGRASALTSAPKIDASVGPGLVTDQAGRLWLAGLFDGRVILASSADRTPWIGVAVQRIRRWQRLIGDQCRRRDAADLSGHRTPEPWTRRLCRRFRR
jgi:hypothetical protein